MAGLKEIRIRIASVKSTMQITSAMKMVAAAKLRKAQDKIIQLRPYVSKLEEILTSLNSATDREEKNIYSTESELNRVLIILITSNRGLCGAFNTNVAKYAINLRYEDYDDLPDEGNVEFMAIGKKGAEFLKQKKIHVIETHNELYDNLQFNTITPLADKLIQQFLDGEYNRIDFVYNHFKNAAVQLITREQFLPILPAPAEGDVSGHNQLDYIFEPDSTYLIDNVIPWSLRIRFYKAILDSYVAEQGARMTAMHKATDNATELLRDLTLHYNKARQATITKEILEIVGGAEALKE